MKESNEANTRLHETIILKNIQQQFKHYYNELFRRHIVQKEAKCVINPLFLYLIVSIPIS